jgi:hypothetical protein
LLLFLLRISTASRIVLLMKTTTKTERAANVVMLSRGAEWVRFELPREAKAAIVENSEGGWWTTGLTEARQRVTCLVAAGWKVEEAR